MHIASMCPRFTWSKRVITPKKYFIQTLLTFLPRDAMHKRGLCRHAVSVCLSRSWIMTKRINNHIFEIFSPSGSHTILVCPYQTGWRYSDGAVEYRWGICINRDSGLIAGYRSLLDVRSTKNSYRRPCSVDRTLGGAPANVCDGLQHGRIRLKEENRKEFNCTRWYIWSRNN